MPQTRQNPNFSGFKYTYRQRTPFAHIGSKTGCGATIITGENRFTIELHQENPAPLNQESDEYLIKIQVVNTETKEILKNRSVTVEYNGITKQMTTDGNGEIELTHEQSLTARIAIDFKSPKMNIKNQDLSEE